MWVPALAFGQPLRCADMSMLDELEGGGAVYTSGGVAGDALAILAAKGLNAVRLRLFHTPTERADALTDVRALARRAHALNLEMILNLHYSDTWADPGTQTKPSAWTSLSHMSLRDSVYAHTFDAVAALEAQGTPPTIVQIGNEITTGMLWDSGRVGGTFDLPEQWQALAELLSSAASAVRAASAAQVMIHIDRGGDRAGAEWFFDSLAPHAVDYDLIGVSFYPFWHGDLNAFADVVGVLEQRYQKPVVLVETAYPFTLAWNDQMHNGVGLPEHVLAGYPATPEGQADFLNALWDHVTAGVCYWAPEYVSAPSFSSPWENLALFDFTGEVLPAADALGAGRATSVERQAPGGFVLVPNPVRRSNGYARIHFAQPACGGAELISVLGRQVRLLDTGCQRSILLSIDGLVPGRYWVRALGGSARPLIVLP